MSGGVDSSVAAALLVEQGYDVTGIMLKLWRGEAANLDSGCCNVGAASDARRVADVLGIPFYVLNFAERFEETVIANFHADYAAGELRIRACDATNGSSSTLCSSGHRR